MKRIALVGMLVAVMQAQAVELHVDPKGSDENPGTKALPVKTIGRARDRARQAGPGTVVFLHSGNYFAEQPIRFDERDSHTSYRSYGTYEKGQFPTDMPTIYGGRPVTGWQKWKGNIWRAKSPSKKPFRRLFIGGRSAILARHPNLGSGYGGGVRKLNNTTIGIPKEWKDYTFAHAQVYGWLGANWFTEMRGVESVDRANLRVRISGGSGQFRGLNGRVYIQGVPELLDEPSEWALNAKDGHVYYWPDDGCDPNNVLIVAATTERVLDIRGSGMDTPVASFTVEGLHFVGSDFSRDWWLFDRKKVREADMPEPLQQGLIHAENAKGVAIRHCKIIGAGHSGVYLNHWAQDCEVYGCWIEDAGFAGVYMNGYAPGRGPFASAAESDVNTGHRIVNNFIYDCGKFVGAGCGIQFYQSSENEILHNRIARMPRYGISYKGIRFGVLGNELYGTTVSFSNHWDFVHTRNNRLTFNDISNVCLDSFDFGGIEAWGPGRDNVWEYNAVHDIAQSVKWDGWAHGLFTDDACHYHTVRGNVVYALHGGKATGAFMVKSCNQVVENNIVAACPIGRIFSLTPYLEAAVDMTVRRNIVDGLIHALHDYRDRSFTQGHTVKDVTGALGNFVKGKPVYREVDGQIVWPKPQKLETYRGFGWEKNAVVADPLFVRRPPFWKLHYTDFELLPESPALKAGFEPIPLDKIGLLDDFHFDRGALAAIPAGGKIQGENATRIHRMRPTGGTSVTALGSGSWVKYANVGFGTGEFTRCHLSLPRVGSVTERKKPGMVTTWDVAGPYTWAQGDDALTTPLGPETGEDTTWIGVSDGYVNRAGRDMPRGLMDFPVVFENPGLSRFVAYLQTTIDSQAERPVRLVVLARGPVKIWVNDEVACEQRDMPHADPPYVRCSANLKSGPNTIRLKLVCEAEAWQTSVTLSDGATWLPADDLVRQTGEATSDSSAGALLTLHLDSPQGTTIGAAGPDDRVIRVKPVHGRRDLYVSFHGSCVMDHLQFGGPPAFADIPSRTGEEQAVLPAIASCSAWRGPKDVRHMEGPRRHTGETLGWIDGGDWIYWGELDFNRPAMLAMEVGLPVSRGGKVECRLDTPTGPVIATLTLKGTGSYTRFSVQRADMTMPVSGKHHLYTVFSGGAGVVNLKRFRFEK